MGIEDVEIQNPTDMEADLAQLGADMFELAPRGQQEPQGEQNPVGEAQPPEQYQEHGQETVPNEAIRLDKMRKQRDEARDQQNQLANQMAELKGKLSVLEKGDVTESAPDATEYMDETQKFLFNENKSLKETLGKLTDVVSNIQNEGSKRKLQEQENRFFESNPSLKTNREQFVGDMLDYLETKPSIKSSLKKGEINLSEVYGMYSASKPQSTKTTQVGNPDKIFSGHSESVPSGRPQSSDAAVAHRKAVNILNDRHSTNKGDAAEFLKKEITNNIISLLDN